MNLAAKRQGDLPLSNVMERTLAPLGVTFILFVSWVALLAVPGAWLLAVIYFVTTPSAVVLAITLTFVVAVVVLFWRRHPISGVTMVCGLTALILLSCLPTLADSPSTWVAHLAQVVYYRGDLLRQEAELKRDGISPAVAVLGLDGFGSLTSGIALDRTGEILLPAGKRSALWMASGGQTELGVDSMDARHIIGDYYAWSHN